MNSVRSSNLILKYQRFPSSGCRDIGLESVWQILNSFIFHKFSILRGSAPTNFPRRKFDIYGIESEGSLTIFNPDI